MASQEQQFHRLLELISTTNIAIETMPGLPTAVEGAGFTATQTEKLQLAIGSRASSATAAVPTGVQAKLNDFTALPHYFPKSFWDGYGGRANPDSFVSEVWDWAYQLGMRHPSEPTHRVVAAMMLHAHNTPTELRAMTPAQKQSTVGVVKGRWKARMGRCQREHGLHALPVDTETYKAEHPDKYATLYKDAGPVACPNATELQRLVQEIRCRGTRGAAAETAQVMPFGGNPNNMATAMAQIFQPIIQQWGMLTPGNSRRHDCNLQFFTPPPPKRAKTLEDASPTMDRLETCAAFEHADEAPAPVAEHANAAGLGHAEHAAPQATAAPPMKMNPAVAAARVRALLDAGAGGTEESGDGAAEEAHATPEASKKGKKKKKKVAAEMPKVAVAAKTKKVAAVMPKVAVAAKGCIPETGPAMKKPAAAKVGGTYFHNKSRASFIVKQGTGKGSTTTLAYGPGKRFARAADAEKEAKRIVGTA